MCSSRAAYNPAGTDPGPGSDDFLAAVLFFFGFGSPSGASSALRAAAPFPLAPLAVAVVAVVEVLDGAGEGVDRPAPPGPPAGGGGGAPGRAGNAVSSGAGEDCPASAISRFERMLGESENDVPVSKRVCNLNTNAQYSWNTTCREQQTLPGSALAPAAIRVCSRSRQRRLTVRTSDDPSHARTRSRQISVATLARLSLAELRCVPAVLSLRAADHSRAVTRRPVTRGGPPVRGARPRGRISESEERKAGSALFPSHGSHHDVSSSGTDVLHKAHRSCRISLAQPDARSPAQPPPRRPVQPRRLPQLLPVPRCSARSRPLPPSPSRRLPPLTPTQTASSAGD